MEHVFTSILQKEGYFYIFYGSEVKGFQRSWKDLNKYLFNVQLLSMNRDVKNEIAVDAKW